MLKHVSTRGPHTFQGILEKKLKFLLVQRYLNISMKIEEEEEEET